MWEFFDEVKIIAGFLGVVLGAGALSQYWGRCLEWTKATRTLVHFVMVVACAVGWTIYRDSHSRVLVESPIEWVNKQATFEVQTSKDAGQLQVFLRGDVINPRRKRGGGYDVEIAFPTRRIKIRAGISSSQEWTAQKVVPLRGLSGQKGTIIITRRFGESVYEKRAINEQIRVKEFF